MMMLFWLRCFLPGHDAQCCSIFMQIYLFILKIHKVYADFRQINNNDVHHIDKKTAASRRNPEVAVILSVPEVGLEPTRPQWPRDFKSLVSTIPPFGRKHCYAAKLHTFHESRKSVFHRPRSNTFGPAGTNEKPLVIATSG